jgi:enoyl-CoA hydratase
MDDNHVLVARDGAIATITLSRPAKLNALTFAMLGALESAAHDIDADAAIRVAIITGAGEKAFCAGGDIHEWSTYSADEFALTWVRQGHRAFDALARLRQPLIAALNGHTLGGGLEIAACADFRVAEEQIKIALPETSIGIIPGWSGTQRMVRRFGSQTVRRLALAGDMISPTDALALGVVDRLVGKGGALAAAKALADQIIARSALATSLTKLLVNAAEGEDREAAIEALGGGMAAASTELLAKVASFQARKS